GIPHSAHATSEDLSMPSTPADNGNQAGHDPEINFASNAKDHSPQDDHAAHPTDPPVDPNPPDSFKFANGDSVHPGSSGPYEPAALAPAKPFDVSGMSAGPDQLIFAENAGHGPGADHKTDMTEIDNPVAADIQQVLDTAHETNAVSPPEPSPATALPETANAQAPYHQDAFHFA